MVRVLASGLRVVEVDVGRPEMIVMRLVRVRERSN